MSTTVRTRRSSQPPPSRRRARTYVASESVYDTYRDQRDEITTNNAPAWQSPDQRTSLSRRPEGTFKKTTVIDVNTSPVEPSDSISKAPPRSRRWEDDDYSARRTNVSTRSRPKTFRRYSSEDAERWSTSRAPLTANNLEELNDVTSEATKRSRRTERRSSSAQGDTRIERWRQSSGTATQDDGDGRSQVRSTYRSGAATNVRDGDDGRSQVRSTYRSGAATNVRDRDDGRSQARSAYRSRAATKVQDDQDEEVIRSHSKSAYRSRAATNVDDGGEEVSRSQAKSAYKSRAATTVQDEGEEVSRSKAKSVYTSRDATTVQDDHDDRISRSKPKSGVATSRRDSAMETTAVAAGAAGATTFSDARRRKTTDDYDTVAQSRVTARRSPQAPPPTSTGRELAVVRSSQQDLGVVEARGNRAAPPSIPEFGQPYGSDVGRRSESPPEMEWEKQVRTREYVRPSDGKLIEIRECLVRRIRPQQQPARVDGSTVEGSAVAGSAAA